MACGGAGWLEPTRLSGELEQHDLPGSGVDRLRPAHHLERAAAVAGERVDLLERTEGLEDRWAATAGAEEPGKNHR